MLAAALAGAWWRGARWLLPLAAVGLAAPLYVHLGARLDDGEAAALLLVAVPLYAALALAPFLAPRRGDLWGVLGAAIVPVAVFWPLLSAWDRVLGDGYSGLLPVLLGANSLMGAVSLVRTARAELGDNELAILVAVTLLAVAVAIPVQLDEAWLTVGWAIEVALLAWARRRIPHGLLTGAAALLAVAVSLRLLLNPWALEYGHAEGLPILNWTLYTWGVPLVAFLVAARLFESAWMRGGLRTASVFIAFALLNLEIAHAFAVDGQLSFRSERLGEEMTRSIAWGGYGLGLVLLGIRNRSRATRLFGLAFAVLGAGKVFLVDMWSLSGFARVGAFGGMAVTLLAAAVAFAWLARADSSPSNAPEKSP
jgi:uncharacterized membrane protein